MTPPDAAARDVPAAQRLLLDIIDTVREPLIVLDPEFRVTQANRAFFRTFRVEPEDTGRKRMRRDDSAEEAEGY